MAQVDPTRPILFLDVDGVLNCLGRPEGTFDRVEAPASTEAGAAAREDGLYACVPHGMRERVTRLCEAFDPVWATAWRGTAHRHFRTYFGLPIASWPYIDYADLKLPPIVKYGVRRSWAWVDDDAQWELDRLHPVWAEIPKSLIITPDPKVGLTDEHVDQLLAFAESVS